MAEEDEKRQADKWPTDFFGRKAHRYKDNCREDNFIVQWVSPENERWHFGFKDLIDFITWLYMKVPVSFQCPVWNNENISNIPLHRPNWSFSEFIPVDKPQKIRFDLDWKGIEPVEADQAKDLVIKGIIKCFPAQINISNHIIIAECHRDGKCSYHIIIDGFIVTSRKEATTFISKVKSQLISQMRPELHNGIDTLKGAYLRMIENVKLELPNNPFRICREWQYQGQTIRYQPLNEGSHPFTDIMMASLITSPHHCIQIEIEVPEPIMSNPLPDGLNFDRVQEVITRFVPGATIHTSEQKSGFIDLNTPRGICIICNRTHDRIIRHFGLLNVVIRNNGLYLQCGRADDTIQRRSIRLCSVREVSDEPVVTVPQVPVGPPLPSPAIGIANQVAQVIGLMANPPVPRVAPVNPVEVLHTIDPNEPLYNTVYNEQWVRPIDIPIGGTLLICSYLGTGKSTAGRLLIQREQLRRTLILPPRRIFAYNIKGEFNLSCDRGDYHLENLNFVNYLDHMSERDWTEHNRFIVSPESIYRLTNIDHPYNYDLVFIDEIESVLRCFSGDTLAEHASSCFKTFCKIIRQADRVVGCDAFLTKRSYNFLRSLRSNVRCEKNIFPPVPRGCVCLSHFKHLMTTLIGFLRIRKKIFCFCGSKKKAKKLYDEVRTELPELRVIIYTGDTDSDTKKELEHVREVWTNYDLVITTSVITVGVNFDEIHFDLLFCYSTCMGPIVQDVFQSLMRARKINDNIMYYTLMVHYKKKRPPVTRLEIEASLERRENSINISDVNRRLNLPWETNDPIFLELHKANVQEDSLSKIRHLWIFESFLKKCGYNVRQVEEDDDDFEEPDDLTRTRLLYDTISLLTPEEAELIIRARRNGTDTVETAHLIDKYLFHQKFDPSYTSLWLEYEKYWINTENRIRLNNIYDEMNRTTTQVLNRDNHKSSRIKYRCKNEAPKMEIVEELEGILGLWNSCIPKIFTYEQFVVLTPRILELESKIMQIFEYKPHTRSQRPEAIAFNLVSKIFYEWSGNSFSRSEPRRRMRINGVITNVSPYKFSGVMSLTRPGKTIWYMIRNKNSRFQ